MLEAERRARLPDANWQVWPNDYVEQAEYATAGLKVAQAYYEQRDYAGMRSALLNVLTVQPGEPVAERDLAHYRLTGGGGSAPAASSVSLSTGAPLSRSG